MPSLESFLTTDPRDAGCAQTLELLHVYVDEAFAEIEPGDLHPGVAAHLRSCSPCAEDWAGLLAAVRETV